MICLEDSSERWHAPTGEHTVGRHTLPRDRKNAENAFWEGVVKEHGGRMLCVARRLCVCESEARDAVQDAFLNAFSKHSGFAGRAALGTWLHRITVNCCLMRMRSRARRPARSIETLLPAFDADGRLRHSGSDEAPRRLGKAEFAQEVRRQISELPDAYRVVLVLRDIELLSTEETAAALDITACAVKARLHRARMALTALLQPYREAAQG